VFTSTVITALVRRTLVSKTLGRIAPLDAAWVAMAASLQRMMAAAVHFH
jgi:hypothetical protein